MKELIKTFFNKRRIFMLCFLVITIACIFVSSSLAKYFIKINNKKVVTAENLYVSSDLLALVTEENQIGNSHEYYYWPESFNINIFNYSDAINYTNSNIEYSVQVTGATFTDASNGIINGGSRNNSTLIITPNNKNVDKITVEVTIYKPYRLVYRAEFNYHHIENESFYFYEDKGTFVLLYIQTDTDIDNISISWPSTFIPDNNNEASNNIDMSSFSNGLKTGLSFEADKTYILRFFKNGGNSLPQGSISINSGDTINLSTGA